MGRIMKIFNATVKVVRELMVPSHFLFNIRCPLHCVHLMNFIQAEEGFRSGLTSELTFAVTVWALLIATLVSPIAFRRALRQAATKDDDDDDSNKGTTTRDMNGKSKDTTRRDQVDFETTTTPTRVPEIHM